MKLHHFVLSMSLFAALAIVASCHKGHDMEALNITHPAAFVVNGAGNTVSVIDLTDDTKVHDIELNGATFPHHIYLNPNKSKVAVAITNTDLSGGHGGHGGATSGFKVQIISTVTGVIEKEISTSKLPHNAVFSPSGTELWIPQSDTPSKVLVYRTSDWTQTHEVEVGHLTSEVTFSADGSKVYAANTDEATLSVIDPTTKTVSATIAVGTAPVGAWTADNGKMYVDNETSKTVMEIDVATDAITATIDLGYKPGYVAYSDHHAELWVSDADNGKIHYYKLVGGTWTQEGEFATGADAHAIAFNADGTKAYVTNQGAGTVSVIQLSDHTKIKDIAVGSKPNGIVLKQ
ncbi:MAG: YncE family protein [Bacteroidia bacterium]|nr:YncE family protein [Bacteroidia bacterium]